MSPHPVAIHRPPQARYPERAPFHPPERYPELPDELTFLHADWP